MQIIKKKKYVVLGVFAAFVLSLALFHHALICFGVKTYLNARLPKGAMISFSYEKGRWDNGDFILQGVALKRKVTEGSEGFDIKVDDLRFSFHFKFFPFKFSPKLTFEHPQIALLASKHEQKEKKKGLYQILEKHFFKTPVRIEKGELYFGREKPLAAYFTFESADKEHKGTFKLSHTAEGLENPVFSAAFSKRQQGLFFDLAFQEVDLKWAYEMARFFFPKWNPDLLVEEGKLQGQLALGIGPPAQIEYIKYDLNLKDLNIEQQRYGVHLAAQHISWKEHFNSNDEMGRYTAHPFFEKMWPYFIGEGNLSRAIVSFHDPKNHDLWATAELKGKMRFSRQKAPLLEFHGILKQEEHETPFQVMGEGLIDGSEFWKLALDLKMMPEGGEQMETHLMLMSRELGRYLLSADFEGICPEQLSFMKRLFVVRYPSWERLDIASGLFDGKLTGWVEDKTLKRIEVKRVHVKEAHFEMPKQHLSFQARSVTGKGEFDFSTPDFFDGTFWELCVEEAVARLSENQVIEELEADLAMHDQYIKPSSLSGRLGGVEGEVKCEGLYTHLNLNLDFALSPQDLFALFGQPKKKKTKQFHDKLALDLDVKIKTVADSLSLEGVMNLLQTQGKSDAIEFGLNWESPLLWKEELTLEHFKEAFKLGWFKANDLSDVTFNLPLQLWGKSWQGQGKLDVEGTFNRRAAEFTIDPSHLTFVSPDVVIRPSASKEEKPPSCTLNFDFEEQFWRGKVPLKNAVFEERSIGLAFDTFNSELDIEGFILYFQNVDAVSSGVHFVAEMVVDYTQDTHADLKIQTSRIEGSARDVQAFMRHFSSFTDLNFPLEGQLISQPGEMALHAYAGDKEELLQWDLTLHLIDGKYEVSPCLIFENLSGDLTYNATQQAVGISQVKGDLVLKGGKHPKSYHLNIPSVMLNQEQKEGKYDIRVETLTHDIFRIKGSSQSNDKGTFFTFDRDHTYFFGAKGDIEKLAFSPDGSLSELDFKANISSLDLYQHIELFSYAGLLPFKPDSLAEVQAPQFVGETAFACTYNRDQEVLSFEAESDHFSFGQLKLDHLNIHGDRKGNCFKLDRFEAGSLSMTAKMEKKEERWDIPSLEVDWKGSKLQTSGGTFVKASRKLTLPIEYLKVLLEPIIKILPLPEEKDWGYLTGALLAVGECEVDLSHGLKDLGFSGELKLIGEEMGKGKLRLESSHPLEISFHPGKGFQIKNADFYFLHPRSNQLWTKCHFDGLTLDRKTWQGDNFKLIIPPEMIHFLGETQSLPHLSMREKKLFIFNTPLKWDNQIEATFDFKVAEKTEFNGRLKEGYYWIGDQAWYFNDFTYAYRDEAFDLAMNTLYDEMPFDLNAHVSFVPHLTSKIVIQETLKEDRAHPDPLTIQTSWNQQEGFFIQNIDGQVCGLAFSFHHNPKESFLDRMVLTGQLKMDIPVLAKMLPKKFQEAIEAFEVGKGYELSGDLVLSKENLGESHFTGYFKGKHFQLMGSEMETLLSEVTIYPRHVEFANFNMSDTSGIFSMNEIRIECFRDQKWHLTIPELMIQDFRPSLLKKIGKYRGRIKPLTVRDLNFYNIRGTLGEKETFTGKGQLNFINTFKRDYNLLDIPLEIIGRLGLDMGLLVPVRGKVDFVMVDGRVYMTELSHSYSEGKRSQFFLSSGQPSYIDFDGNLNLNIRMKQYVLLKITEPFMLSIGGTFENPKYSLR